ncbi:MAG: bifunctional transaldolase/phosoglucose isomerase [Myxococcota bacterium]|nr:bifunctional transaldolase/phosoglucose isomerase [Myxococcota bacterium]
MHERNAALRDLGQSIWLDYIRRDLIATGELSRLVEEGVRGVTSNPTIFEKAIGGSSDYDGWLERHVLEEPHESPDRLYERLAVDDVRAACDVLRPVWEASDGIDGWVSLEVSPGLAHDAAGTVAEARRLRAAVDRPNVMIKVPATDAGIDALGALLDEGIAVNVTLLFGVARYERVAHTYVQAVERANDPRRRHSVASFFVSRIDAAVDPLLERDGRAQALALRGRVAVANARVAYARFRTVFSGPRWEALRARGARPQRLLWASTGVKDPRLPDVLYVESLAGPDTVNTMPPSTYAAWLDHGRPRASLLEAGDERAVLDALDSLGIRFDEVVARLEADGLSAFARSFDALRATLADKRRRILERHESRQHLALGAYEPIVRARLDGFERERLLHRLWARDPTIWRPEPEPELVDRLGWLTLHERMEGREPELVELARSVRDDGIERVLLLGMGGSSLAPEVFRAVLGRAPGHPELEVLDTTHPDAVEASLRTLDPSRTLVVVASKSGTTIESQALYHVLWDRCASLGAARPSRFVAITDPGTPLEHLARERGFRRVFLAPPDVGGRYSALSVFGLLPAALVGIDPDDLLDRAWTMAEANAACVPPSRAPAARLGAALGELVRAGRDKVTFVCSPALRALPAWIEQLLAESTGKDGTGIVPVADEELGPPDVYGTDRVFVAFRLEGDGSDGLEQRLDELERAGHPVVRLRLASAKDIAQEMVRFEIATAIAGAVLGIHPFNQPDVQLAKQLAADAMAGRIDPSESGAAPVPADDARALEDAWAAWIRAARPGDYVALQAFLAPSAGLWHRLQAVRHALRDRLGLATTLGWGPRFLHSTGQLHKGDGNRGLFLQLVDEPAASVPVPETSYDLRRLLRAQADGDALALRSRGRRLLRVNLGAAPDAGLQRLLDLAARASGNDA